jgi:hypothetical protein
MPLLRLQGKVILFVHIPKTAGSAVWMAFLEAGAARAMRSVGVGPNHSRTDEPYARCEPQHAHAKLLSHMVQPGFYDFAFTVYRNPYDRLASEYRMQMRWRREGLGGKEPLGPEGFDTWVQRVLNRHMRDSYAFDNHIRPQHEFLLEGAHRLRYEDGVDQVRELCAEHGVEIPPIPEDRHPVEVRPLRLSPQTLHRVRKLYAKDFEVLGYDPDDLASLLPP